MMDHFWTRKKTSAAPDQFVSNLQIYKLGEYCVKTLLVKRHLKVNFFPLNFIAYFSTSHLLVIKFYLFPFFDSNEPRLRFDVYLWAPL